MKKNANILDFRAEIQKSIPDLLLVTGEDPTLGNFVIDCAKAYLQKKTGNTDGFFIYVGAELNLEGFHSEFFNLPLFGSGERIFVIKEAQEFFKKLKADKDYAELLTRSLGDFPAGTKLLMIDAGSDTAAGTRKMFPGLTYFKDRQLYDNEKSQYIAGAFAEEGFKLDNSSVDFLIQKTDGKPQLVKLAISQIKRAGTAKKELSQRDIAEVVDVETTSSVFPFIEKLMLGDVKHCLDKLDTLELQSESYLPLLSLLLKELVRVRRAQSPELSRLGEAEAMDALDIPKKSPYWRQKRLSYYRGVAGRMPKKQVFRLSSTLSELQSRCKQGLKFPSEQKIQMERLILQFA